MATPAQTVLSKLEAERLRLAARLRALEADWASTPKLLYALVLAIPAWVWGGPAGALVTCLFVLALVGTSYYIVGVRRADCLTLMDDIEREIQACLTSPGPC